MMRYSLLTITALSMLVGCKNNDATTENPDSATANDGAAAGDAPAAGPRPQVRTSTSTSGGSAGANKLAGAGPRVKAAALVAKQPPTTGGGNRSDARPRETPDPVEIIGFFPPTAGVGSVIEVYGSNFGANASTNYVLIGGKKMRVVEAFEDRLVVKIASEVSGPVEIAKGKSFSRKGRSEVRTTAASFTALAQDGAFGRARASASNGLIGSVYDIGQASTELPTFGDIGAPVGYVAVDNLNIAPGEFPQGIKVGGGALTSNYGVHFQGSLNITESGTYEFCVNAGDGALLYLDQQVIVDGDGAGAARETCESLAVEPGEYAVDLLWYHNDGPMALQLTWAKDGGTKAAIPASAFFMPDVTGLAAQIEQAAAGG
jgi:hypothetical protein